ncbi:hypothetical protein EGW08_004305, partial [Elysia chlorotica]
NGKPQTWKYDVEEVVERFPANDDGEADVRIRLITTSVFDDLPADADVDKLPLAAKHVVFQIYRCLPVGNIHLEPIVGPGPELELAGLIVEREVGDIDLAGAPELGGWGPEDIACVVYHGLTVHVSSGIVVCAV